MPNISALKESINFYLNHLYTIDFLFIFLLAFLFLCGLIFAAFLSRHPIIALFIIVLDIFGCAFLGYFGYDFIDKKVRTRTAELVIVRIYGGSNLVIDYNITNLSKQDFRHCNIQANFRPPLDENASTFKRYKAHFFPLFSTEKPLQGGLLRGKTKQGRLNFNGYDRDANLSIELATECF